MFVIECKAGKGDHKHNINTPGGLHCIHVYTNIDI